MKVFYTSFIQGIALIIGGFFCPPIGVIDGSVLTAVGLLILFATLEKNPEAIKAGKSFKVSKGDLELEVSGRGSAFITGNIYSTLH